MKKDDVSELVAVACFSFMVIILFGALFFAAGKVSNNGYHEGEIPVGMPVMLYWYESDGTISGASAVRTDYAGVFPHSTTMQSVPYTEYKDWDFWYPLENVEDEP